MTPADDDLVFMDENSSHDGGSADAQHAHVWRVMIIDDDEDVHSSTTFALSNLEIQHRPLNFLHAYSAAQAREVLARESDIAVILLDVVMEQDDAGLQLVRHIRETCGMAEVRIILRTGQPGYAPEIEAIRDYDINDYKTKSELTRIKLFTTVTAAIRSYEQIRAINASRRGLDLIVRASTELMAIHGLQNFAAGVITQIAGLLSLKPEGLLCVQDDGSDTHDGLFIIAAAGNYTTLINRPISAIGNTKVINTLSQAIKDRRNIYGADYTALYFAGSATREFAAFLNTGAALNEMDKRLLEVFCSNISVGLDNVMLVSRLHQSAFYDPLCKLPNRTRTVEIVGEMLAGKVKKDTTLALVDIDHFSEINDTLGHQFGDQLLLAVAARFQKQFGEQVSVSRVGGDTFALIGSGTLVNPATILSLFNTPFSIDGEAVQLSSTLGLVRLTDYQGGSGAAVIKDADIALKRAKLRQRAGHSYFSPNMETEIRERVRLMHALRSAFEKKRLFVVYQPQIDLATRRPVGAEALLRWKSDDGTLIPPDCFIPIAEYSGLIIDLGEWVLRSACQELVRLRRLGFHDFMMSINVSQAQFRHPRFLDMLELALEDTQAPATAIELEITESMAMEDPATLIKTIAQIKKLGVSVAIDDFGTGFSSLNYLQQLHVDRIKIDRAFVTEITSAKRGSSIAQMIIQLGHNLGLSVIAEGVEDDRQAEILLSLGCPLAQGFLFARPMMADDLPKWLETDGDR
ncbi:MAG: EAL domain-containing protein [Burkholderiales bacterium]|nr:EAL domain-containing protein [Burkholderiales bacterium]